MREAVLLGTLHAPTLVVDADQHVIAYGPDRGGQCRQLRARLEIARKQDHAAGQRMHDPANIVRAEHEPGHVEDDRAGALLLVGDGIHAEGLDCSSATAKATA